MREHERPDCYRCQSFFITYDERQPYGCRAFGMKSRALPSVTVKQESGEECRAYTPKPPPPE